MRVYDVQENLKDKLQITVKPTQIYYWEQQGLLGKIFRSKNNRRSYNEEDIKRIVIVLMLSEINTPLRLLKRVILEKDNPAREIVAGKLLLLKNTIIPTIQNYLTNHK